MWLLCAAALLMALALGACLHIPDAEELLSNTASKFSGKQDAEKYQGSKTESRGAIAAGQGCCARTQGPCWQGAKRAISRWKFIR